MDGIQEGSYRGFHCELPKPEDEDRAKLSSGVGRNKVKDRMLRLFSEDKNKLSGDLDESSNPTLWQALHTLT